MKDLLKPENAAEANAIKAVLADHGIYAEVKSFYDTAYDGLFQAQKGWGVIRVAEKDFDSAEEIVDDWKKATPEELPWEK